MSAAINNLCTTTDDKGKQPKIITSKKPTTTTTQKQREHMAHVKREDEARMCMDERQWRVAVQELVRESEEFKQHENNGKICYEFNRETGEICVTSDAISVFTNERIDSNEVILYGDVCSEHDNASVKPSPPVEHEPDCRPVFKPNSLEGVNVMDDVVFIERPESDEESCESVIVEETHNYYDVLAGIVDDAGYYAHLRDYAHRKRPQTKEGTMARKFYSALAFGKTITMDESLFVDRGEPAKAKRPLLDKITGVKPTREERRQLFETAQKAATPKMAKERKLATKEQRQTNAEHLTMLAREAIREPQMLHVILAWAMTGPDEAQVATVHEAADEAGKRFIIDLIISNPPFGEPDFKLRSEGVTVPWFMFIYRPSHQSWNKLMHALNGNIDYIGSSVVFGGETAVLPGANEHLPLYTNSTNHTVAWRKHTLAQNFLAAVIPFGVTVAYCLQIVKAGSSPVDIVPPLLNDDYHQFLTYKMTTLNSSLVVTNQSANASGDGDIVVPPGATLYLSHQMGSVTGLGAVNITAAVNAWEAKSNPILNVFNAAPPTEPKPVTVYIKLPGKGYKSYTGTVDDGIAYLKRICAEMDAYMCVSGRIASPEKAWVEGAFIDIIGRTRGGSSTDGAMQDLLAPQEVGQQSPILSANDSVGKDSGQVSATFKTTDALLTQMREKYLKALLTDCMDGLAGSTSNTVDIAANVWAALAKPDQVVDANLGKQIGNRFPLQWVGSLSANTSTAAGVFCKKIEAARGVVAQEYADYLFSSRKRELDQKRAKSKAIIVKAELGVSTEDDSSEDDEQALMQQCYQDAMLRVLKEFKRIPDKTLCGVDVEVVDIRD